MGGRIDAQSTLGKGSRFTVLLPYRPAAEAPATTHSASLPPQPEAGNALMGIRVLLAEDDEINRIVAEDLQSEAGAKVTSVTNGSEVVERVAADGPEGCDVILMDIQMPVMDGFEATNKIQVIAPDLPIISLSAHAIEEERVRFEEAGMAAHVTKPFIPDHLIETVLLYTKSRAGTHQDDVG